MIKELKYGGFTANPNDHDSIEGDLAVAMNLIPENATIKPILPPGEMFEIPSGGTIMCIHKAGDRTNHIMFQEANNALYLLLEGGVIPYDGGLIHQFDADVTVRSVEPVGNTLVVLASDGIHYILWKYGAYRYLGAHLPELDLQFSLYNPITMASDKHDVDLGGKHSINEIRTDKDLKARLCQAVLASANQLSAMIQQKKRFAFPFFVRYAYRLYDGRSISMHSAPALMVPTMNAPEILMGWTVEPGAQPCIVEDKASVSAKAEAFTLFYHALSSEQVDEVARWADIIASIDVYISPLFYTYDQAIKDEQVNLFSSRVLPDKDITREVCDNGNFYLIKSIKINDIYCGDAPGSTATGGNRPSSARPRANVNASGVIVPDFDTSNDNIVVHERMIGENSHDDYGTHDDLIATRAFAYNRRVNLAGMSRRLFQGFNPACMWFVTGEMTARATTATVVIDAAGREITVRHQQEMVYYDSNSTIVWFFYPDAGAKRAYLDMDGSNVMIELTEHPLLNGAYYYGLAGGATSQQVTAIPQPSSEQDRIQEMPNKIYTSEVDNPFYFPFTGVNSIGVGNVIGLCAAVRPVSTGQYGYADLYVFADNGIWTAKINDHGTYDNFDLASGDVCINPDSITQMETSVLFTTVRGIMLLSGSQAQCISGAIDDEGQQVPGLYDITDETAPLLGLSVNIKPFREFLGNNKDNGCRMIYDYRGRRIIVYNPATSLVGDGSAVVKFPYAYIYSLESNKWGMMQSDISYTVKDYPKALAVTHDGHLVNYSEPCSVDDGSAVVVPALLVTRPLTLDQPDILKTVNTVLQRGLFRKHQQHVQSVLYGSRDLYNWHLVQSSTDENMRGRSGTPYKWFRIGLILNLENGESITGCSIHFEPRYNNRLR